MSRLTFASHEGCEQPNIAHVPQESPNDSNEKDGTYLSDQKAEGDKDGPIEAVPRDLKGYKWIVCVLAIFSSVFLYALDNTIVATIQPAIIQSLGELEKLPWVSVAYQVTSVASDLTW
jgi:hypothetical protein